MSSLQKRKHEATPINDIIDFFERGLDYGSEYKEWDCIYVRKQADNTINKSELDPRCNCDDKSLDSYKVGFIRQQCDKCISKSTKYLNLPVNAAKMKHRVLERLEICSKEKLSALRDVDWSKISQAYLDRIKCYQNNSEPITPGLHDSKLMLTVGDKSYTGPDSVILQPTSLEISALEECNIKWALHYYHSDGYWFQLDKQRGLLDKLRKAHSILYQLIDISSELDEYFDLDEC
jgi:hypothetical protein